MSFFNAAPRRRPHAALATALCLAALAAAMPAQAQSVLDKIKSSGQINVGYRSDAAPFSYLDDRKQPMGYSIDICGAVVEQIKQQLGLSELRVKMTPIAVDRVMRFVKDGVVDILCSSTSDTPERREEVSFSKPIYIDGVAVMVRKKDGISSIDDFKGKAVVVIKTTTAAEAVEAYQKKHATGVLVESALNADAALSQLQLGWVQGYARDRVLLAMQLASLKDGDQYAILPGELSKEAVAIAFRKGDAGMEAVVNKAIAASVSSGKANAWYDKWFVMPIPLYSNKKALGIPMSSELKASFESTR
ncbi:amino acid ABC transporter substrate-binding protein [Variovorax dokdonensis]|uniref:Amino acid ABC transporter substrate-binding protein n=1 Tax=Variovorax dokdonensis TaxID=344883 RepID=A0ABT7N4P8_9BURK|nr:amino acid ABC transporter substrate-binding protein [Variovorax dokdonensis]MDM0042909.1 amino acid ABC transporter substrate-binding protein [Variovorax dokdonensis]